MNYIIDITNMSMSHIPGK